jgi:hypothetical protein
MEDCLQKDKFDFFCAGRLASKFCGIVFNHNSHPPATRAAEPASESIYIHNMNIYRKKKQMVS